MWTRPRAWLMRHDPGLAIVRRAARVTLVACVAFFLCRYALDNVTMAPYALFGVVAMGALSQIPGSPAQRARTLLAVLPVGWVLVTLGTLLSVSTATAVAGMFVLGFAVAYAGIGGPRLVGLATGTQLLYILPCFPPFDPGSLGFRLAGLTLGVLLLAAAEVTLWPDATPTPYTDEARRRRRRARRAASTRWPTCGRGSPAAGSGSRPRCPRRRTAAEALRPSRLPPGQRPASAGRRDRALASAAGSARLLLGRTLDLSLIDDHRRRHAACGRRPAAPDRVVRRRGGRLAARSRRRRRRRSARHRPDRGCARRRSAPPATPSRPTASPPSGCSSARSR